jgi:hypothetical protein
MTIGRRILDFVLLCLAAVAIYAISLRLWPYFGLVAPVVVVVILAFAISAADGLRYIIFGRRPS